MGGGNYKTGDNSTSGRLFSAEVPQLLQTHLDHLRPSGISLEAIQERGYRSVLGRKELAELGFSARQQRLAPGLLIPLWGVDGQAAGYSFRPDHPRIDGKDRPRKYEISPQQRNVLDVPPRCRHKLDDPSVDLYITEGAKKADGLATSGACAININGIYGWRGTNPKGGKIALPDWETVALNGRKVYLVPDSDVVSNPNVRQAISRLGAFLSRKGTYSIRTVYIPPGPNSKKVGVDDYLAQGHSLEDLNSLAREEPPSPPPKKAGDRYVLKDGCISWVKRGADGEVVVPLCNFLARAVEDVFKDDGIEESRFFTMEGRVSDGRTLPRIQVPASSFSSLGWVTGRWGLSAVVAAGVTAKDRLREAIQLLSQDAPARRIYTHTGWRDVGGRRGFLTAAGAIGLPEVQVELEGRLQRYRLPTEPATDTQDAVGASLDFLEVGEHEVTVPLWAAIYLAPLSEILEPAFTLWLVGPTGAFKSTGSALALCHFGTFTMRSLPASWRDTTNHLEKMMALAKDVPLVIDDWAPPQDVRKAREYESKAEEVDRAQGNRQGRGRLRADTSTRPAYIPRGVVISSGEQLPGGQSHTARLFSVEVEHKAIDRDRLTVAQRMARVYPIAMASYIRWLAGQWADIERGLPSNWETWREQARVEGEHARLPEAVAWLYAGFDLAMAFAEETGAISHSGADDYRALAWEILLKLASSQGARVEEESPSRRFLEGLKALMDQGRVIFRHKDEEGEKGSPWEIPVGWKGDEGLLYLNPKAAYAAVYDFCRRSGEPLTFKPTTVWKDLRRRHLTVCEDGRTQGVVWAAGEAKRVVKLKLEALRDV